MPRTVEDVVVPSGGDVYQAPIGTVLPTDLTTPLPAAWENIGFLSNDNPPTVTGLTRDVTDLFAWNVDTPLRTALAPFAPVVNMELLQPESEEAFKLFFGGGTFTPGTAGSPDKYEGPDLSIPVEAATIIDVVDGDKVYRMMFPRTETRANGDMPLGRGAFVVMPIAMSVLTPTTGHWLTVLMEGSGTTVQSASSSSSSEAA